MTRAEAASEQPPPPLLPTHVLQMLCQRLKSTKAYFSQVGKDQLVDHYDPIRLPETDNAWTGIYHLLDEVNIT